MNHRPTIQEAPATTSGDGAPPARTRRTEPLLAKLRWGAGDAATITRRYLIHLRAAPERAVMALLLPLVFTLLFVYVLGSNMRVPEGDSYVDFLIPGMLAQMTVFGIAASASAVADDRDKGITDRLRSLPMSRTGVPVGQSLAESFGGLITLLVMAGCGLLVGWRPGASVTHVVAGLALLLFARYAFSWLGMWLGLVLPSRSATDLIGMLTFPLTMVSNIFVPSDGLPHGPAPGRRVEPRERGGVRGSGTLRQPRRHVRRRGVADRAPGGRDARVVVPPARRLRSPRRVGLPLAEALTTGEMS